MEQPSIEQQSSEKTTKPYTLDGSCYDLNMLINESGFDENGKPTHIQLNHENLSTDYLDSYSPLLENYMRFSTSDLNSQKNESIEDKVQNSTPPVSPSFLRVSDNTEEHPFTTRSSSLNRTVSSGSGQQLMPVSPSFLFSNPTSPLVTLNGYEDTFPNYALLSTISHQFIACVKSLNERRRMFCTAEYPESFTGVEAVSILRLFLPTGLSDLMCLNIARALNSTIPPLIAPIPYSERSIRKKKIYYSANEIYTIASKEETQGVFTPLTRCYSISCLPGQLDCYASTCPNRPIPLQQEASLHKLATPSVGSSVSHDTGFSRAWSASVTKDKLMNLPKNEISRQEAIHELIYTEEDYVRDLKLLDELYVKELQNSQVLEEPRKDEFCKKVFNNYQELLEIHKTLCGELKDHQAQCQSISAVGIVDRIGHIFLRHVKKFLKSYLKYGPHVLLAEFEAKSEAETNILFQTFIREKEKRAESRRLPFRHFIILPVTRLQRYSLLLDAVYKKTSQDHSDRDPLKECIEIVKNIASQVDSATTETKNILRLNEINKRIRFKPGEPYELDLLKPGRKLLKEGTLTRRSHLVVETVELHVFLFDHFLLMTKTKKALNKSNDVEYTVSKRPIPMNLLHIQEATEGFSIGLRTMNSTATSTNSSALVSPTQNTFSNSSSPFGGNHPILIQHLGRHGADHMLYAESATARIEWKEKVIEAKASMETMHLEKRVFEIQSLSDTTFGGTNGPNSHSHGKVTCTVPFKSSNGKSMISIGTQQGVWIGIEGNTTSIKLALSISDVTQIAVLEDHRILLVLSDKTLFAYALEPLLTKEAQIKGTEKLYQKIAQHISFFRAGICNGRTLVVAMKKRGVDSHFKVLEPICGDLRDPNNSKKYFTKSGLFSRLPSWFKNYKEFYIGTESYSVHFLKIRLVVICSRGFEIVNMEELNKNRNLPDPNNPDFGFIQQKNQELKPLGMFRSGEKIFLLCYNDFAFQVNKKGELLEGSCLIEWEGIPQSVAFSYPYVIGFDSRFIEIRDITTGELVQVLAGTHMRCLQYTEDFKSTTIHGCMAHPLKPDFQYVFSLVNTFPVSS